MNETLDILCAFQNYLSLSASYLFIPFFESIRKRRRSCMHEIIVSRKSTFARKSTFTRIEHNINGNNQSWADFHSRSFCKTWKLFNNVAHALFECDAKLSGIPSNAVKSVGTFHCVVNAEDFTVSIQYWCS